ncbi:MAG TPA: hypothetical protein EYQ14_30300 [Gammaproteobacteria bacterium]|nr:hypothetical protein [Gammaproteobacteria bacterium]HIL97635.1 hypothetical protein [Pseudomonadales bacterium]
MATFRVTTIITVVMKGLQRADTWKYPIPGANFVRGAAYIFVIASLLFCIFIAAKAGLGDLAARRVEPAFTVWREKKIIGSQEWSRVYGLLLEAVALRPGNPDYHLQLGQLYSYRRMTNERSQSEYQADLRQALVHFQSSVEKRNMWGFGWAYIASTKSLLGELDGEFSYALERAVTLGPWEPPVQRMVSNAAFRHWFDLSVADKALVRENSIRGLQSVSNAQSRRMTELIRSQNKHFVVCPYLKRDKLFIRVCTN